MDQQYIFNFKTDIYNIPITSKLNNPFSIGVSQIARIAATEFQVFISNESKNWTYDFDIKRGKMFGVLVIQQRDNTYAYLGTVSGKLSRTVSCDQFIPSVFDDAVGDYFMNRGMTKLTEISDQIKMTTDPIKLALLKEKREKHSIALQRRLFENYNFSNLSGNSKNLIEIFEQCNHGNPASGAGECAAPKLLQYAITHDLKPIALAEFWWGNSMKNEERQHKMFYPACRDKCRPILEFMLEDDLLYERRVGV